MIYGYSKRPNKFKTIVLVFILIIVVAASSIYIYSVFTKIDVIDYSKTDDFTATRLYNDAVSEDEDITSKLEDISRSIVRNIKNKKQNHKRFRYK